MRFQFSKELIEDNRYMKIRLFTYRIQRTGLYHWYKQATLLPAGWLEIIKFYNVC